MSKKNNPHFVSGALSFSGSWDKWDRNSAFISNTKQWTGKENPSDFEIWTSYLKMGDNDMWGLWLFDVVNIFINTTYPQIQNDETVICILSNAIEFYLWVEKRKFVIQTAKNETEKQPYFVFEPSGNPRKDDNRALGIGDNFFDGNSYLLLKEDETVSMKTKMNRGLKYDKLVPPDTLKRLHSAEKKLYAFLSELITLISERGIFTMNGFEKFPVQEKVPLFLLDYCKYLFEHLSSTGKKTKYIRDNIENLFNKTQRGRLLWVYKVFNKKQFSKDLNTIILNEQYSIVTDSLKSMPIDVPIPEENGHSLQLWSLQGKKISERTETLKLAETTLSKNDILECLFAQHNLLRDEFSSAVYLLVSRNFDFVHPLLKEYIMPEINSDKLLDMIEIVLNSFGKSIVDNMGILLMIFKEIITLSEDDFNRIFNVKTDEEISDMRLYLKLSDEKFSAEYKTPKEWLLKKYLEADDRKDEKQKILHSFLFFLLWNQLKHLIPLSDELAPKSQNSIGSERLQYRQKMINKFYENALAGNCSNTDTICELYNEIYQSVLYSKNEKLNMTKSALESIDNATLCHLIYNLSQPYSSRKRAFYREMTFISDKKKRILPTVFNKNKKFNTEAEAKAYLNKILANRKQLKEIDCGMTFGIACKPVTTADVWWNREMNFKFFTDSDKVYFENSVKVIRNGKKFIIKIGEEDFRITNKNHLENYYFYETLRNPDTHASDVLVIHALCDDNKIEYLLKALFDCNEFAKIYLENIKMEKGEGQIWIPTLFFMRRIRELAELLAAKMTNLPDDKRDFETWFDKDGSITLNTEYYVDISYSDDFAFLDKVKALFTKLYCLDYDLLSYSDFEFDFGIDLTFYLIYLNAKLMEIES